MSYNVNFDTVANSISGITISGVQVLDIDKIPVKAELVCPVLFPKPNGYITNFSVTNDSLNGGTGRLITLRYNLTYVYCHAAIGTNLSFGFYNGMVSNVAAIISKLLDTLPVSGCQDFGIQDIVNFGPVNDPAGNVYHGCEIVLNIMQFGEV